MECIEECPEYFSISEFRNKFSLSYGAVQASIISENIFSIGDPTGKTIDIMFNEEKNQNMYKINISEFGEKLRNIINSSDIVDLLTNVEKEEFELFTAFLGGKRKAALRLISIFGYISFRTNGVEDPEIVININDSEKLQEVIADDDYKNSFIEKSDLRHKKEIMLQKEFFENDMRDSMRWEYIENYFLGKM